MTLIESTAESAQDPFGLVTLVAEEKGWDYQESEMFQNVLDCTITSDFGEYTTHVAHMPEKQLLRVVISMQINKPSPMIINDLYRLINAINDQVYYGSLVYGHDEPNDRHYILYSANLLLGETGVSKEQVELHFDHLVTDYNVILPAWYAFLGTKPVVSINADGIMTDCRPGASVEDCLELIETGRYGRA